MADNLKERFFLFLTKGRTFNLNYSNPAFVDFLTFLIRRTPLSQQTEDSDNFGCDAEEVRET